MGICTGLVGVGIAVRQNLDHDSILRETTLVNAAIGDGICERTHAHTSHIDTRAIQDRDHVTSFRDGALQTWVESIAAE